jgi:hypothetical protein
MGPEELKEALKENLDSNGRLQKLRAATRAQIYQTLGESEVLPKPPLTNENLLILELLREFLVSKRGRE